MSPSHVKSTETQEKRMKKQTALPRQIAMKFHNIKKIKIFTTQNTENERQMGIRCLITQNAIRQ